MSEESKYPNEPLPSLMLPRDYLLQPLYFDVQTSAAARLPTTLETQPSKSAAPSTSAEVLCRQLDFSLQEKTVNDTKPHSSVSEVAPASRVEEDKQSRSTCRDEQTQPSRTKSKKGTAGKIVRYRQPTQSWQQREQQVLQADLDRLAEEEQMAYAALQPEPLPPPPADDVDENMLRPTRAGQLRQEYLSRKRYAEVQTEKNIYFLKGRDTSGAAVRIAAAEGSQDGEAPAGRLTKAAQLLRDRTSQRLRELEEASARRKREEEGVGLTFKPVVNTSSRLSSAASTTASDDTWQRRNRTETLRKQHIAEQMDTRERERAAEQAPIDAILRGPRHSSSSAASRKSLTSPMPSRAGGDQTDSHSARFAPVPNPTGATLARAGGLKAPKELSRGENRELVVQSVTRTSPSCAKSSGRKATEKHQGMPSRPLAPAKEPAPAVSGGGSSSPKGSGSAQQKRSRSSSHSSSIVFFVEVAPSDSHTEMADTHITEEAAGGAEKLTAHDSAPPVRRQSDGPCRDSTVGEHGQKSTKPLPLLPVVAGPTVRAASPPQPTPVSQSSPPRTPDGESAPVGDSRQSAAHVSAGPTVSSIPASVSSFTTIETQTTTANAGKAQADLLSRLRGSKVAPDDSSSSQVRRPVLFTAAPKDTSASSHCQKPSAPSARANTMAPDRSESKDAERQPSPLPLDPPSHRSRISFSTLANLREYRVATERRFCRRFFATWRSMVRIRGTLRAEENTLLTVSTPALSVVCSSDGRTNLLASAPDRAHWPPAQAHALPESAPGGTVLSLKGESDSVHGPVRRVEHERAGHPQLLPHKAHTHLNSTTQRSSFSGLLSQSPVSSVSVPVLQESNGRHTTPRPSTVCANPRLEQSSLCAQATPLKREMMDDNAQTPPARRQQSPALSPPPVETKFPAMTVELSIHRFPPFDGEFRTTTTEMLGPETSAAATPPQDTSRRDSVRAMRKLPKECSTPPADALKDKATQTTVAAVSSPPPPPCAALPATLNPTVEMKHTPAQRSIRTVNSKATANARALSCSSEPRARHSDATTLSAELLTEAKTKPATSPMKPQPKGMPEIAVSVSLKQSPQESVVSSPQLSLSVRRQPLGTQTPSSLPQLRFSVVSEGSMSLRERDPQILEHHFLPDGIEEPWWCSRPPGEMRVASLEQPLPNAPAPVNIPKGSPSDESRTPSSTPSDAALLNKNDSGADESDDEEDGPFKFSLPRLTDDVAGTGDASPRKAVVLEPGNSYMPLNETTGEVAPEETSHARTALASSPTAATSSSAFTSDSSTSSSFVDAPYRRWVTEVRPPIHTEQERIDSSSDRPIHAEPIPISRYALRHDRNSSSSSSPMSAEQSLHDAVRADAPLPGGNGHTPSPHSNAAETTQGAHDSCAKTSVGSTAGQAPAAQLIDSIEEVDPCALDGKTSPSGDGDVTLADQPLPSHERPASPLPSDVVWSMNQSRSTVLTGWSVGSAPATARLTATSPLHEQDLMADLVTAFGLSTASQREPPAARARYVHRDM